MPTVKALEMEVYSKSRSWEKKGRVGKSWRWEEIVTNQYILGAIFIFTAVQGSSVSRAQVVFFVIQNSITKCKFSRVFWHSAPPPPPPKKKREEEEGARGGGGGEEKEKERKKRKEKPATVMYHNYN